MYQILTPDLLIAFFIGVVIPFLTNWMTQKGWPVYIETFANVALSAATTTATTLSFDGNWQVWLMGFGVAWTGALRGHYSGLAQAIYSDRVTGRHEKQDQI